ncbi:hypothetical protein [Echinicola shivajiensis]|uniref:hypothetical protein n=1 Tax=Echinicola shivajiensis TaxID=1035916 RepID=UPI001BFC0BCC|nr:hypothetical protein [Echinicola shivajiensis]
MQIGVPQLRIEHLLGLGLMALFGLIIIPVMGQQTEELPLYKKAQVEKDWLVESIDQTTQVYQTSKGDLVLSNGLVSRVFDVQKGGATIGLENLMTGENLLRSIRPEAMVEINGLQLPVGGMTGQPIHNYLLDEWIDDMKVDPRALKLEGYKIGATEARFEWQKRMDWMPKDMPWPAPGKKISFVYSGDDKLIDHLLAEGNRDEGRKVLFNDEFQSLADHWEVYASPGDERNSFINEGKAGEIMALANQSVSADLKSPNEARVWIVKVDPGTDQSASWGIGMALIGEAGNIFKFNIRPGDQSFGIYDGKQERKLKGYDPGKTVYLRAEQIPTGLSFSYSYTGENFQSLESLKTESIKISELRVGKMDPKGGLSDFNHPGPRGRGHVEQVLILGELSQEGQEELAEKLTFLKDIKVLVHYEMYDGMPLLSKWIEVLNKSDETVVLDSFKSEILALVEAESAGDPKVEWMKPNITVETDYRFGGMSNDNLYLSSIAWNEDPLYKTQVNYNLKTPVLLEAYPKLGPMKTLRPGEKLNSFRTWELLHDSWDRDRKGLAIKRMYRSQAPWVTENPIMMHVRNADNESVKKAIDQCAEVGFELVIMTFGSGFQIENDSPENMSRMKELADYAHSKGIALGGYSLLASRSIDEENDVVMPQGKRPRFGNSPCLESEWGINYFDKLYDFYERTGQDILEHDGSYPGDVCASHDHPGHKGLADSQWNQYEQISTFYKWAKSKGIFLNVPDHYFMSGSNKTGMGYRETNWSLPRAQQEIIERQNIYDGTWEKTPSMGWMFVPLVEYHGGGKAATIEPLKDHLPHYEQRLANLFGAGVQACYRGPQLYDSPKTKETVKKWVDFYKEHREVLDADVVHIRRPDGRDYDGLMHVNPLGKEKGLIMLYNPLNVPVVKEIKVDLYYTGLKGDAELTDSNGRTSIIELDRDYHISLPVNIPANGQQWFVIN